MTLHMTIKYGLELIIIDGIGGREVSMEFDEHSYKL